MNEGGTPYTPKRLKTTRWGTRAAAWALVAALLIPMLNWARVYAAETPEGGLCVHHPAHTLDCGFVEASLGSPCSLSPDTGLPEDQVYTPGSDALPEHVHDETCGYVPAQEGHPCTYLCPYCASRPPSPPWTARSRSKPLPGTCPLSRRPEPLRVDSLSPPPSPNPSF